MSLLRRVATFFCSLVLIVVPSFSQQASPPAVSASVLIAQSLAAQLGNTQISDVTLTGTAHRIAGSDDESGSVTVKVLSSGATRLDFNFRAANSALPIRILLLAVGPAQTASSTQSLFTISLMSGPGSQPSQQSLRRRKELF